MDMSFSEYITQKAHELLARQPAPKYPVVGYKLEYEQGQPYDGEGIGLTVTIRAVPVLFHELDEGGQRCLERAAAMGELTDWLSE